MLKYAGTFIIFLASAADAEDIFIFGDSDHDVFLGCLNCSEFESDSICNKFGAGSAFKTESIFNRFSKFGSAFSTSSPWNKFNSSDDVPVLVDKQGNFYGYFTINKFRSNSVDFASDLADMYDIADGELEIVQNMLCSALGP